MSQAKYNSEEILSSIQSLPEESLEELVNLALHQRGMI